MRKSRCRTLVNKDGVLIDSIVILEIRDEVLINNKFDDVLSLLKEHPVIQFQAIGCNLRDKEAFKLAEFLERGFCPTLRIIDLKVNHISSEGVNVLRRALANRKQEFGYPGLIKLEDNTPPGMRVRFFTPTVASLKAIKLSKPSVVAPKAIEPSSPHFAVSEPPSPEEEQSILEANGWHKSDGSSPVPVMRVENEDREWDEANAEVALLSFR